MEAKHFSIYFHVCQPDTKEFNCLIQNVKRIPEGSTSWKRTRCQEDVNSSSIVCWRKGSISGCWFCELVPKCFVKKGCTWSAWEAKLCLWKELGTHAVISLVSKRPDSYFQFAFLSGISRKKTRRFTHSSLTGPCWFGLCSMQQGSCKSPNLPLNLQSDRRDELCMKMMVDLCLAYSRPDCATNSQYDMTSHLNSLGLIHFTTGMSLLPI